MSRLNQVGDTIIEVLFAVAVAGLTIASAYSIATLSLKNSRQAQERGEALKIAESQFEAIRSISASGDSSAVFPDSTDVFCIEGSTVIDLPAADWPAIIPIANDNLDLYEPECVRGLYHVAVQASDDDSDNLYDYTVTVRWFSVGNNNKDELKLLNRMYNQ